jgi:hypothetical protein
MLMIREVAAADGVLPEFSLEALAAVVTPAAVDAVIHACGVRERRVRKLPAATTVFFCIALNLSTSTCLGQVFARLVSGLRWLWPQPDAWPVSAAALCHARARLGARPLVAAPGGTATGGPVQGRLPAARHARDAGPAGDTRRVLRSLAADGAGWHEVECARHTGE